MGRRKQKRIKASRPIRRGLGSAGALETAGSLEAAESSAGVRLLIVRYAALLGWLSSLVIAPKLWLNNEHFGPISVFGAPGELPASLDLVAYGLQFVLLIPAFWNQWPQRWIHAWLVVAILRCSWDRILWQPYLLQYFFMILIVGCCGAAGRQPPPSGRPTASSPTAPRSHPAAGGLGALRLIFCGVYFWSGFSKFHHGFLHQGAGWLFGGLLPDDVVGVLAHGAWAMPAAETLLAIGLLTRPLRRASVLGLIGMHVVILGVIGPLGKDVNHVVWPWNLVMMACLPTLFWRVPPDYPFGTIGWRSTLIHKLALLLFVILPAFSYVRLWPIYLSFRMYSVREPRAYLEVPLEVADQLPAEVQGLLLTPNGKTSMRALPILEWSGEELNATAPTELAVYHHVAAKFCTRHGGAGKIRLVIRHEPDWWTGESRWERIRGNDL